MGGGTIRKRRKGNSSAARQGKAQQPSSTGTRQRQQQQQHTRNTKNNSSTVHGGKSHHVVASSLFLVAVVTGVYFVLGRHREAASNTPVAATHEEKVARFLIWFHKAGGQLSPKVTLASFPEYGNGLLAKRSTNNSDDNHSNTNVIQEGEELMLVPKQIQFQAEVALDRLRQSLPNTAAYVPQIISSYFHSSLEQQDTTMALELMVECSLGQSSSYYEFLSILPLQVPRLDTFSDDELKWLQDPFLEQLAQSSRGQIQSAWENGLALIVTEWAKSKASAAPTMNNDIDETCLSLESFHRFVAIVSSHAMILDNTKYLVPMADMINHAPRRSDGMTHHHRPTLFADYHVRNAQDGSIMVLADRATAIIEQTTTGGQQQQQQLFEEYGTLDNSIYLAAFGFVPENNPYHCVVLPSDSFPPITDPNLREILTLLEILPKDILDTVCVKSDLSILQEEGGGDQKLASYLSLAHLEEDNPIQRRHCINAFQGNNGSQIELQCTQYAGHRLASSLLLQAIAKKELSRAETSLEDDLSLLGEYTKHGRFPDDVYYLLGADHTRAALALQFRIADKQVLRAIETTKFN